MKGSFMKAVRPADSGALAIVKCLNPYQEADFVASEIRRRADEGEHPGF